MRELFDRPRYSPLLALDAEPVNRRPKVTIDPVYGRREEPVNPRPAPGWASDAAFNAELERMGTQPITGCNCPSCREWKLRAKPMWVPSPAPGYAAGDRLETPEEAARPTLMPTKEMIDRFMRAAPMPRPDPALQKAMSDYFAGRVFTKALTKAIEG